jgi:hypothetical protein
VDLVEDQIPHPRQDDPASGVEEHDGQALRGYGQDNRGSFKKAPPFPLGGITGPGVYPKFRKGDTLSFKTRSEGGYGFQKVSPDVFVEGLEGGNIKYRKTLRWIEPPDKPIDSHEEGGKSFSTPRGGQGQYMFSPGDPGPGFLLHHRGFSVGLGKPGLYNGMEHLGWHGILLSVGTKILSRMKSRVFWRFTRI